MATSKTLKSCSVVIVAGGKGVRMGRPKQFIPLGGKPVILYSIEIFRSIECVNEIIVVVPESDMKAHSELLARCNVILAPAGATRLESVINGIAKTSPDAEVIAVHDAARPLVPAHRARECMDAAFLSGAAVLAVPASDTIKQGDAQGTVVVSTPDRTLLWQAQTPQCYRADVIRAALEKYGGEKDATDESQLVEKTGVKVSLVRSEYRNIKITVPEDLVLAEALMRLENSSVNVRTGIGYDVHRMVAGRPLILGGVNIPHSKGLLGHSDGDALLHAVCDAILGACGAGEIGIYFPPTDLTLMGMSSKVIAEKTMQVLDSKRGELVSIDAVIVAEEPKLVPHYAVIRKSLSAVFGIPVDSVGLKAKTQEGLGEIGRGEALCCQAVATIKINS